VAVPPDDDTVASSMKLVGTDELGVGAALVVGGTTGADVTTGTAGGAVVAGAGVVVWP